MPTQVGTARTQVEEAFATAVQARTARVGIIGLGYVGLPLALLYVEQRFPVVGFDIDNRKVDSLNQGASYIHRIPSTEIGLARERGFNATTDYAQIRNMDAVL